MLSIQPDYDTSDVLPPQPFYGDPRLRQPYGMIPPDATTRTWWAADWARTDTSVASRPWTGWDWALNATYTAGALLLAGFTIYGLVISWDARDACGPALWNYSLAAVVLHLFSWVVLFLVAWLTVCASGACGYVGAGCAGCLLVCVACAILAIPPTMIGLGSAYAHDALGSQACLDALSAKSFNGTPVLLICVLVYVGFDALLLLFMLLCMCAGACGGAWSMSLRRGVYAD